MDGWPTTINLPQKNNNQPILGFQIQGHTEVVIDKTSLSLFHWLMSSFCIDVIIHFGALLFKSRIWYLPILLIYPSIGLLNNWIQSFSGASIPSPHFSVALFLGYCTVFFMTYGEELGLTGYAIDLVQQKYSALKSGILRHRTIYRELSLFMTHASALI